MKYSILAILMLAFVGCSGGTGSATKSLYYDQITDWQSREVLCQSTVEVTEGHTALAEILDALHPLVLDPPVYTYQQEDDDYWQTSDEMEVNKAGDCEDITALWYATIREHQIVPDHLLFMRIVEFANGISHSVLVIQADEGELYFSSGVLMSKLEEHTILVEFDLWTIFL